MRIPNPSLIKKKPTCLNHRLIGDCCAVIGELPEACVNMMVPCKLVGEGGKDEEKVSVGKEQILELGSRAYVRYRKIQIIKKIIFCSLTLSKCKFSSLASFVL